jgi:hypothetical protein
VQHARAHLPLLKAPSPAEDGTLINTLNPRSEVGVYSYVGGIWVCLESATEDVHNPIGIVWNPFVDCMVCGGVYSLGITRKKATFIAIWRVSSLTVVRRYFT